MARRLKYPARCYYCNVITKDGFLQRTKGNWYAHCDVCYQKKQNEQPQQTN